MRRNFRPVEIGDFTASILVPFHFVPRRTGNPAASGRDGIVNTSLYAHLHVADITFHHAETTASGLVWRHRIRRAGHEQLGGGDRINPLRLCGSRHCKKETQCLECRVFRIQIPRDVSSLCPGGLITLSHTRSTVSKVAQSWWPLLERTTPNLARGASRLMQSFTANRYPTAAG